jgi:DNA mismatch repair protein MutS2
MNRHALQVLQFAEALASVAALATSAAGRAGVLALRPATRAAEVEEELRTVAEAAELLRRQPEWGMPALPEIGDALQRLRVEGSMWEGGELRAAATLMASGAAARGFLDAQEEAPRLHALVEGVWDAPPLRAEIARAVGEDGEVLDDASPLLARVRREIRTLRGRLVRRLEEYMASLPPEHRVSDASVTVREGRYVIPVRREGRGSVGGLVHGESATGGTLFVEPPLALEHMNRLRELEGEEEREVRRILRELTGRLRPHRQELAELLEALTRLDTLYARGRYAARHDAVMPRVVPPGSGLRVVRGRHPLLLAQGAPVVPFDLELAPEQRTLLVSGPNTGGKTVLLKAIGLISLLAQSGVIPPVAEGTRLPLFTEVFGDIGDEQSIEASLSTFSAHLRNLAETLSGADGGSLVLVDEIGSGTDPTEGAALARAILLELTRRGALTVATTHLGQLKLLATEDERVVNASLEFDAERLEPTYRLQTGMPGRSYGLAIARRLGLPAELLEEAEAALPQGERDVGRLLLELETRERQLTARLEEVSAREAESARRLEEAEARQAELAARAEDAERRARQQARDLLLGARQEVERAIQEVRGAASAEALEEAARGARRRVEEAARRQREKAPAPQRPAPRAPQRRPAPPLAAGERVRVLSLGRTGTVLELREGRATVETGGMRLQLAVSDLEPAPESEEQRPAPRRASGTRTGFEADARTEVDLRGLRVEEMDLALGRALDAAVVSGLPSLRIIHGLGTGALRERVGEVVAADPRVASARPGERGEGGLGVTVVELR